MALKGKTLMLMELSYMVIQVSTFVARHAVARVQAQHKQPCLGYSLNPGLLILFNNNRIPV